MIRAKDETVASSIEIRLPSKAEWVGVARLAIAGIASRLDFSYEEVDDLKLAVSEAINNLIQHAHGDDEVRIACDIHPDKLVITVQDLGEGISDGVAQRTLGEPKEGGLGVFLIRTLMDDVTYDVDPRTGTRLSMTKHLRKS